MRSRLVEYFSRYRCYIFLGSVAALALIFAVSLFLGRDGRHVTIELGPEGTSGYSFYSDLPPVQITGDNIEFDSFTITITFEAQKVNFGESFKTSGLLELLLERGFYEEGHGLGTVRVLENPARIIIDRPYYARPYAVAALRGGNRLSYTITVYESSLIGSEVLEKGLIIFRKFREQ